MRELVALDDARLCVTTRAFLDFAGLRDLVDLPPLQDLASDDANQAWGARV
jgi:chromosome segregation and condensation protein ScpB